MPFTFSGNNVVGSLRDFGNDAAQMILQTGATIQQGLQSMMTNRQVQALGAELGTLNPESPEWAQQAVKLGSRYPLAMKSPAGQFILGTQAKAHAEWRQAQQATRQSNLVFQRQLGLENVRTQNDIKLEGIRQKNRLEAAGTEMMDLTPSNAMGQSPMGVSFGTDETQFQDAENLPMGVQPRPRTPMGTGVPLFGEEEDLAALAPGERVKQSLLASGITKIPAKEFRREVAAERRADMSRSMQEDRQRASETAAEKRAAEAEKSRLASEERSFRGMNATTLRQERTNLNTRINSIKRELESTFDKELEDIETNAEGKPVKGLSKEQAQYFRQRKALADELAALTAEYQSATKELEALGGDSPSATLRFDPTTGKLVPR